MNDFKITCTACPRGCLISVKGGKIIGNKCKKGREFAYNELLVPNRTLTTTVKTVFPDFPRLPVRTDRDIPLNRVFDFMEEINSIVVEKPVKIGEVIKKDVLGTKADLVSQTSIPDR
jgi:CxxC motif-containing protein